MQQSTIRFTTSLNDIAQNYMPILEAPSRLLPQLPLTNDMTRHNKQRMT
jgi:hypothetical protein